MRAAARQAAAERGIADGHVITLSRSLVVPFLTFSERRDLREQAWRAWTSRGEHEGEHDNREVARQILKLRNEQARLHGHACYADYALADTMAGTRGAVAKLLDEVWPRALAAVQRERAMLREAMEAAGGAAGHGELEAWDWRVWAERVRQQRYALDDAEIKPYFRLENMVEAAFDCANRLFGLRFVPRADLPVYHPDVKAYEVQRADGATVGVFLQDNFARASKRSGAWMSSLRWQSRNTPDGAGAGRNTTGGFDLPLILNNNNFAKGAPGEPTLLSLDDARTLFHEFGHGLHGLLSNVTYERLSGTQVLRDFVELPSQMFEHWLDRARGAGAPRAPLADRRDHPRRPGAPHARRAPLQPGLRDRALHRQRDRRHGGALAARCRAAGRSVRVRGRSAAAPGPARGGRPEPPAGAFPAPVLGLRLCRGLLRLPVGRGARRRRLRCLHRGRQPVRPARRRGDCTATSIPAATASSRAPPIAAFRGRAPTVQPLLKKRGLLEGRGEASPSVAVRTGVRGGVADGAGPNSVSSERMKARKSIGLVQ